LASVLEDVSSLCTLVDVVVTTLVDVVLVVFLGGDDDVDVVISVRICSYCDI
jgi:hypothetical protein